MKKPVLSIIAIASLLAAAPAFAGSIYKTEPATSEEKAAGKVLELLDAKRRAGDARGASELYAEDAVLKFYWGSQNELHVKEGRTSIRATLSSASIQKVEFHDVATKKVDDKTVKATGRMKIYIFAFGIDWLKEPEVNWELRLDSDGRWRIYMEEQSRAAAVKQ